MMMEVAIFGCMELFMQCGLWHVIESGFHIKRAQIVWDVLTAGILLWVLISIAMWFANEAGFSYSLLMQLGTLAALNLIFLFMMACEALWSAYCRSQERDYVKTLRRASQDTKTAGIIKP